MKNKMRKSHSINVIVHNTDFSAKITLNESVKNLSKKKRKKKKKDWLMLSNRRKNPKKQHICDIIYQKNSITNSKLQS